MKETVYEKKGLVLRLITPVEDISIHHAMVDVWDGWYIVECIRNDKLVYRFFTDGMGLEEFLEDYGRLCGVDDPVELGPYSLLEEFEVWASPHKKWR